MKQTLAIGRIRAVVLAGALVFAVLAGAGEAPDRTGPKPDVVNPAAAPGTGGPKITEGELTPVKVAPADKFQWVGKPPPVVRKVPPKPDTKAAAPSENPVNFAGPMVFRSFGPFTREEKEEQTPEGPVKKEHLTMTKKVVIEMLDTDSVLRGENIVVVRNLKTQETELLDAKGSVEMASPTQLAKGEMLRFEMQQGPSGEMLKNQFILVGDPATGTKATLWMRKDPADPSKKDVIEATRFLRDIRLDTFQATGAPNAIITMEDKTPPATGPNGKPSPSAPKPPADADAAKSAPSGFGGLNMSGPGKVNIRCDAEIFFEGATGKMRVTRNAVLIKEGINPGEGAKISSDLAIITLDVPPPGPTPNPGGAMTGDMKKLECTGRVEIKSGTNTILCDKMTLDMETNIAIMEMDPKSATDTVNVYDYSHPGGLDGGDVMLVPKTMKVHLNDNEMEPGGPMKRRTFAGPPPSNRGNGPKPEDVKPLPDPKAGKSITTESKPKTPPKKK